MYYLYSEVKSKSLIYSIFLFFSHPEDFRFIENTIRFFLVLSLPETVFSLPDVTARLFKSACAVPKVLWHGLVPCRRRGREPRALGQARVL